MTENLQDFLVSFYPGEQLEEGELIQKLFELKEFAGEFDSLKKKGENLFRAQKVYKHLLGQMQEFMQSIFLTAQEDLPAQLLQIQSHLQSLDNSVREYNNSRERKENFEAAENQKEKLFVIFDDPFANLDSDKLQGGLKLLEQIGREYQVLYFTCHESRVSSVKEMKFN